MKLQNNWRIKGSGFLFLCGFACTPVTFAEEFEFNTDILDVQDRKNFDLTPFSHAGYIMPGEYLLDVKVNGQHIASEKIIYRKTENKELPEAKIDKELTARFALKAEYEKNLRWAVDGGVIYDSLPGMAATADLSNSVLNISVPQIYLEYTSPNWDPPARWDNGVNGILLDYNLNASSSRSRASGNQNTLTGSGTAGANLGAWRFRADWQLQNMLARHETDRKGLDVSRYYLFRPLPRLRSTFTAGENYLASDIFDSFRFVGASLESDVSMLPPSLRGYAPEVNGVAESNATVVISQQGRILYQTQVPPGPFSIQDLNAYISGVLDVEVKEEDGRVQKFQVATASLPYLTRPGAWRYKFTGGRPSGWDHHVEGPVFAAGEASWGVSNGWSLYGGLGGSDGYQSAALGVGRDLYTLGAISTDVTVSRQDLHDKGTSQGRSLRINYAKVFEEFDSQVTFAGYRFSEENFYSMSEYFSALKSGGGYYRGNSKERYDLSFNKRFAETGITTYLTYSHQSYWNRPSSERLDLTFSHYFDFAGIKNISGNVRAYRQSYHNRHDDGLSLGVSIPLGNESWMRYDGSINRDRATHGVGYSGRTGNNDSYYLRTAFNRNDTDFSGFWSHQAAMGDISVSGTHSTASRNTASVGLNGGLTMTSAGMALHGSGTNGGTRLMIDTDGVAGVTVQGAGRGGVTNSQGLAVMNGVGSYSRTQASIALDKLGDEVEAIDSVTQLTLTQGAIGYRKMEVVSGQKGLALIRLADGSAPPFGAMVFTSGGKNAGIVADDGQIWLSGMKPGEVMQVRWDGQTQCEVALPAKISSSDTSALLLPCDRTSAAIAQQTTVSGSEDES
jgi:outer membrane usher protein FimD/PapC